MLSKHIHFITLYIRHQKLTISKISYNSSKKCPNFVHNLSSPLASLASLSKQCPHLAARGVTVNFSTDASKAIFLDANENSISPTNAVGATLEEVEECPVTSRDSPRCPVTNLESPKMKKEKEERGKREGEIQRDRAEPLPGAKGTSFYENTFENCITNIQKEGRYR